MYGLFPVMKQSPCSVCNNRSSDCHSTCKQYLEWREERDIETQKIRDEKHKNNTANSLLRDGSIKRRKTAKMHQRKSIKTIGQK